MTLSSTVPISTSTLLTQDHIKRVDSICPYCGVGCALTYVVDTQTRTILAAEGRDGVANSGKLCVKGRYGFDYSTHTQRLMTPLIRKESAYPKSALSDQASSVPISQRNQGEYRGKKQEKQRKPGGLVDYEEALAHFRPASWDEALDLVANRLKSICDTDGSDAIAGFGSAKGSNEEAYLFQKLIRAGLGTNNVDHCTRLCHASSVAALLEGIGSGAVTNVVRDIQHAEAALITGCNPTENHPVAASFMKEAAENGCQLVVVNPRRPKIADHAKVYLQNRPGTDVALYNAIMHVMIDEDWIDHDFITKRVEGFDALKQKVKPYTPYHAANLCGVPAEGIIEAARIIGKASATMIFWGMGISQHINGTNNARCLIALAMLTGNVGKPGSGLHPLRGQNNVQGASDAGLIPMMYPDYQRVDDLQAQKRFEQLWQCKLSPTPGLTVTEVMDAAMKHKVKGMYIMGENPFLSDPDQHKVRKALATLDFLVVQDIFMTETAEFADVILPASTSLEKQGTFTNTDRRVQLGHPTMQPPGEARQDWEIIGEIGCRLGLLMPESPKAIFAELAASTESYHTLNYDNLGSRGKWYPCADPTQSDGESIVFADTFPSGKARLVPADLADPAELPSDDYPYVLNTGRVLEHWHTGVMTRRSQALQSISPFPFVEVHPQDALHLAVQDQDWVVVSSRRGSIELQVRIGDATLPGSVFIPMHFREAAANVLTNPAIDPWGKIPEFKFCAVHIQVTAPPSNTETGFYGVLHASAVQEVL